MLETEVAQGTENCLAYLAQHLEIQGAKNFGDISQCTVVAGEKGTAFKESSKA